MSFELILSLCLLALGFLFLLWWCIGLHNRLLDANRELESEAEYRRKLQSGFIDHTWEMRRALTAAGLVKTMPSQGEWVKQ